MLLQSIACASCGGAISIPSDIDRLNCAFCGTMLNVQRGEGYIATRLAESVRQSIEEVGARTLEVMREGNLVTQTEMRRVQLHHELSMARLQLKNVEAEGRALIKEKHPSEHDRQIIRREWNATVAQIVANEQALDLPPTYVAVPPHQSIWHFDRWNWIGVGLLALFMGLFVDDMVGIAYPFAVLLSVAVVVCATAFLRNRWQYANWKRWAEVPKRASVRTVDHRIAA